MKITHNKECRHYTEHIHTYISNMHRLVDIFTDNNTQHKYYYSVYLGNESIGYEIISITAPLADIIKFKTRAERERNKQIQYLMKYEK